jgi:hypothetical protein
MKKLKKKSREAAHKDVTCSLVEEKFTGKTMSAS